MHCQLRRFVSSETPSVLSIREQTVDHLWHSTFVARLGDKKATELARTSPVPDRLTQPIDGVRARFLLRGKADAH
jgi:hypothetical protein